MTTELQRTKTPPADKSDRYDLIDKVIGGVCFAVGIGLLIWSGLGLPG